MNFISNLFNRAETIPVSREDLANIAGPLMNDPEDHGNQSIAHGWSEAAQWLRIGFDCESDKGSMYYALFSSLQMIAVQIRNTPEDAKTLDIKREYLEAVKSSYEQLMQASRYLDSMAYKNATTPPKIVEDRHGNQLSVPPIQIYNRPGAAHDLMGLKLEEIKDNLDSYFAKASISRASAKQLENHIPPHAY